MLPFLGHTPAGRDPGKAGAFQIFGLAAETARLHIKCYLFVQFYSGFPRAGDLQHCIEAQHTLEGATLYCLSVDLCLMKKRSDLTDPATCQFWKDQIHSGQILGCGGGPSCETWSAARHTPGGPRPVRGFDHPWGKPGLTKAESHQVSVGTALVQFLLELLTLVAIEGFAASSSTRHLLRGWFDKGLLRFGHCGHSGVWRSCSAVPSSPSTNAFSTFLHKNRQLCCLFASQILSALCMVVVAVVGALMKAGTSPCVVAL